MTNISIVTDSSSDIPPHLAAQLGITVIPLRIAMGARVYRDGMDMDRAELYRHLSRAAVQASAEPPLPEEMFRVYTRLLKNSDQVLSIHLSSKLSRTALVAQEAAKTFLGVNKITVVDSKLISCGLELVVTAAAEAAQRGASMEDIVRLTRGMVPHVYMVFFVENMDHMERQGYHTRTRPSSDGLSGGRPLLILEDGDITPLDKVRTRGKSVDRLFEFVSEFAYFDRVTILQGRLADEAQLLFERLNDAFPDKRLEIKPYGSVLATYLGPDALGVTVHDRV